MANTVTRSDRCMSKRLTTFCSASQSVDGKRLGVSNEANGSSSLARVSAWSGYRLTTDSTSVANLLTASIGPRFPGSGTIVPNILASPKHLPKGASLGQPQEPH